MAFRIGVDVDEVLAEFVQSFTAFHNERYGTRLGKDDFYVYRVSQVLGLPREETRRRMEEFYESPRFENIERVPGAKCGVARLRQEHTLVLVTSRPAMLKAATGRWVARHYGNAFQGTHFADYSSNGNRLTKATICKRERLDLLIEDNADFARECLDQGIPVIMPDRPWNENSLPQSQYLMRDQSWKGIPALVSNL